MRPIYALLITLAICRPSTSAKNVNRQQHKTIESYMDPSTDACDDFYQHACGNWMNVHENVEDYFETIGLVDNKVNQEYAKILNAIKRNRGWRTQPKFVRNLLNYYRSCMTVEEYTPIVYLNWLKEHEHLNWPSILPTTRRAADNSRQNKKKSNNFDWIRTLAILRKYGLNGILLEETIIQRRDNASASLIDLDKPVLNEGFQLLQYTSFATTLEYLEIDLRNNKKMVENLWDQLHVFEVKLKSLEEDIDDDIGYQMQTLTQLNTTWLERYLRIVMEVETLEPEMEITIQNLPYMEALLDVLNEHDDEFLCRYLMIRFLWYLNVEGPSNFRRTDCISHARGILPHAMYWLLEQHQTEISSDEILNIEALFRKIVQHFKQTLAANENQLDSDALQFLHTKLDNMDIKVGNLPRTDTLEKLEVFYQNISMYASDFYANHLQLARFFTLANHALLHKLLPEHDAAAFFHLDDPETGASSSPYYLQRSNIVIVPLTLLRPPIYHTQLDNIFKYSSLGFLLAHEITHGFDETGLEFDQHGNMRGIADSLKANTHFDANMNCLRSLNPQVIDEKIADVTGLHAAFKVYFNSVDIQKSSKHWSTLPLEHLFFLNFAQFFCGNSHSVVRDLSSHGSDEQRVLDTLSNFAEFARVYNCSSGSRMNPETKCKLWR